ncbi:MAG: HEPN domain-containing protein [Candidatus Zixiibacteriota bacterium]|jgi:uncharacterized protein (UPF0332 family)
MTEDIIEEIKENIGAGRERFAAFESALHEGHNAYAVSHLYYVCFYYLRGLLLTKSTKYQTHKGILNGFRLFFVKEGLAPIPMAAFLEKLARNRIEADYEFGKYTLEDVEAMKVKAEEFIAFAEDYLKKLMD